MLDAIKLQPFGLNTKTDENTPYVRNENAEWRDNKKFSVKYLVSLSAL